MKLYALLIILKPFSDKEDGFFYALKTLEKTTERQGYINSYFNKAKKIHILFKRCNIFCNLYFFIESIFGIIKNIKTQHQ